jgi:hypothetical protein
MRSSPEVKKNKLHLFFETKSGKFFSLGNGTTRKKMLKENFFRKKC